VDALGGLAPVGFTAAAALAYAGRLGERRTRSVTAWREKRHSNT
jgi:hypothetical protein